MIGIDLGTTFSVLAVPGAVNVSDGYPAPLFLEQCDVSVLPDPYGSYIIPSALCRDPERPDQLMVGNEAKQAAEEGGQAILFSKRNIGTDILHPLGGDQLTARQAATHLLVYLKSVAEQALGQRVDRAVITHPAYFDQAMKEETALAACDAGFDFDPERHLLMEPVAAALAYTRTDPRDPLRILTYDLGGGTFDVTVMERRGGVTTVKAFGGDRLKGGFNFDRALALWLLERLRERGVQLTLDADARTEDLEKWTRLLCLAESVKIKLAEARTSRMAVPIKQQNLFSDDRGRPIHLTDSINREQFEQLILPLVEETLRGTGQDGEAKGCEMTLAQAGWSVEQLDEILLVGGSSAGPWIADTIRRLWKREPQVFEPDLCVAAGAAIHGTQLPVEVLGSDCRIALDVPAQSVLDTIHVGGRVVMESSEAVPGGLLAQLAQGGRRFSTEVQLGGSFLFEDVDLEPESVNVFVLTVADADGHQVAEHGFEVTHAFEATAETAGILTVLPKPLYIEVLGGMKALAEEGATLPARCEVELRRVNDADSLEIRLFQEADPVGVVVIEKVPAEAPIGAKVKLEVEVSRNNRITGRASVFTHQGAVAAETVVDIKIPPMQVPDRPALEAELRSLEQERAERLQLERSAERRLALQARGDRLTAKVNRMLDSPAIDRQEIWLALRDLKRVVRPGKDDLEPSLESFERLVLGIRELLSARGEDPQVQAHEKMLERLERDGRLAHAKKERKAWAQVNASLGSLRHRLESGTNGGGQSREVPPAALQKMFAHMQLDQTRSLLRTREAELDRENKLERLQVRVGRLRDDLDQVGLEIETIEDACEPQEAQSKLQLLFLQKVKRVEDQISTLGVDVK